jgi:hypothetical protein
MQQKQVIQAQMLDGVAAIQSGLLTEHSGAPVK